MSPDRVVALVPAHDEGDLVGATVRSLASLPAVDEVVVIDDGSLDGTAAVALAAGATVLRIPQRIGKGGALEGIKSHLWAALALAVTFDELRKQEALYGEAKAAVR